MRVAPGCESNSSAMALPTGITMPPDRAVIDGTPTASVTSVMHQRVGHAERSAAEPADEEERDAMRGAGVDEHARHDHRDQHEPHRRLGVAAQRLAHRRAVGDHGREPDDHDGGARRSAAASARR